MQRVKEAKLYFVVETKGSNRRGDLRLLESGKKHFVETGGKIAKPARYITSPTVDGI